ncbi:hypothetical protein Drose_06890 [Dactylosporangium roseum]|uniref:DUF4145 domain-containing protein n=1 Tax=Dactylosporangium roseum TaxID=47989 RepID=A0ABY5Z7I1_9ACTN|nr:hypothetical protein [Dactylosporangium roseum]UWZ37991.1 hypothetical protein Drose_06890 [Dactylosporangium roseum]
MPDVDKLLAYARELSSQAQKDMTWTHSEYSGWSWRANGNESVGIIEARAVSVLEFLRQYAGEGSSWAKHATEKLAKKGDTIADKSHGLGDILRGWVDQVEAGVVEIAGSRAWAEVSVVSTDLMSQVRRLLNDRETHPAAPIVLCGAALEIALRALADARNVIVPSRPTISTLSAVLRQASILTAQDVKDLEQCGGIRNAAAHGEFDILSKERAGLMEQQTNLLLRRLADLHP